MKAMIFCICTLLFFPVLNAQVYEGDEKDIKEILANIAAFSQHVMDSDYDGIAAAYTADGKIFPDQADIIEGYDAIKKRWTLPEGLRISYHKIDPVEIKILDAHAYDYGYYEGTTLRADGSTADWRGKYVIIWKKVDDNWKIYLDIWNRIAPPATD